MQSRKEFLKRIGLSLGAAAVTPFTSASDFGYRKDNALNNEQKEFLGTYEKWLGEFHGFVKRRNADVSDLDNNKKLMTLSAQAEEWKQQLEVHMRDKRFADYYGKITSAISNDIA